MRTRTFLAIAVLVHMLPVAAWASFKPLRVFAPGVLGLHCNEDVVCVDDLSRLDEAVALKAEAVNFVVSRVGAIERVPRAIFCSTIACARSFGFTNQGAYNVGTSGFVVSPRGWAKHFVRHELIHHLQNERFGTLNAWLLKPAWLKEGMAYSLSEDPRRPLPQQLEAWREEFEQWHSMLGPRDMWIQAKDEGPRRR